jgi:hypothetical protein
MVPGRGHVGVLRGARVHHGWQTLTPATLRTAPWLRCLLALLRPLTPELAASGSTPRMQTQTARTVESDRRACPLCRGRLLLENCVQAQMCGLQQVPPVEKLG